MLTLVLLQESFGSISDHVITVFRVQEEAVAAMGTTGDKPSGEDKHQDRSE